MKRSDESTMLPRAGQGKRGQDGHLGYLLRQAAHACRNLIEKELEETGLTQPQFSVLMMLHSYPGHSSADLARLALVTPQTMSTIIANLLKAGLVCKHPHAVHGRILHLELTGKGEMKLQAAKKRVYAFERRMLQGLKVSEETVVRKWLAGLASAADAGGNISR